MSVLCTLIWDYRQNYKNMGCGKTASGGFYQILTLKNTVSICQNEACTGIVNSHGKRVCRPRGSHPKNRQWQFITDARGNQRRGAMTRGNLLRVCWTRGGHPKNRQWRFFVESLGVSVGDTWQAPQKPPTAVFPAFCMSFSSFLLHCQCPKLASGVFFAGIPANNTSACPPLCA